MPFPLLAVALLASAGAGVASGAMQSRASGNATQAQVEANNRAAELERQSSKEALDFQKWAWQQSRQDLQPWMDVGRSALYRASDMMGLQRLKPSPTLSMPGSSMDPNGNDQQGSTRLIGMDGNIVESPSVEQTNFLLSKGYKTAPVSVAPQGGQSQPMGSGMRDWNAIASKYRRAG